MSIYHTRRYRTDPEYRARVLQSTAAYSARMRADPLFRRLEKVRKRICTVRDSYQLWSGKAEARFRQLEGLIVERDRLAAEWREKRKGIRI